MSGVFGYSGEAVRVKVKKLGLKDKDPEFRRFSVDPQITSFEVLHSILVKAFDIKREFTVSYRALDNYGSETYVPLLSDWDLDAAFLSASDPCLGLEIIEVKPDTENDDWVANSAADVDLMPTIVGLEAQRLPQLQLQKIQGNVNGGTRIIPVQNAEPKPQHRLQGLIMNQVERTFNMVQRALNLGDETQSVVMSLLPPKPPLSDEKFLEFQDPVGQVVQLYELKTVIYHGGIEPSLRKVVWKHILNVYPSGMSGLERMDYMKKKAKEYNSLLDNWRRFFDKGQMSSDLSYVTSMVMKDVLRTDRHHPFYAGSDDNQNIVSLFNILTTYALNHPTVSYCQGMSDLASPLLVTMSDEAHAYICFCALMRRLRPNFMLDGEAMTKRFQHLSDGLLFYDPDFYAYLKSHQADDLLFCYRWLLLEMKREFAFEDALHMMEVMWSSLPSCGAENRTELPLYDIVFAPPSGGNTPPPVSPLLKTPRTNVYSKVCALRRQGSGASPVSRIRPTAHVTKHRHNQSLEEPGSSRMFPHKVKPYSSLDDTTCLLTRSSPADPSQTSSSSPSPCSSVQTASPTTLGSSSSANDLETTGGEARSSSTGNLLHARMGTGKSGNNIKHMKERFSSSRSRNVCLSLEKLDRQHGSIREETQDSLNRKEPTKIVKNLNEFLNFSSAHRARVSSTKETSQKLLEDSEENPCITVTKSNDDGDSDNTSVNENPPPENQASDSSPDDSEYLPMTNSMTRELRLELDRLDRNVFGSGYKQHSETSENDDSESMGSDVKPLPMDSPSHSFGYQPAEHSETRPLIPNEENDIDDVFLWENPLKTPGTPGTPDEQADIEYDDCKKSPAILPGPSAAPTKTATPPRPSQASPSKTAPSHVAPVKEEVVSLAKRRGAAEPRVLVTNNCEEAIEMIGTKPTSSVGRLPPPHEFGGGNPFLMFLCLTVLQQHRDVIMHNGMDYNEMAMHFDKMVRKHDVHRVLNQARLMFASYLKQFNNSGKPVVGILGTGDLRRVYCANKPKLKSKPSDGLFILQSKSRKSEQSQ